MALEQPATHASVPLESSVTEQTSQVPAVPAMRLYFADHLRVALTILVVLHHVAVVYAANTPFYYVEPPYNDLPAALLLVVFQLFNQAYFMGFFFLLAGYFTPESSDRKGPVGFFKDRLVRLGIPLVVFIFVLNPLASIAIWQMPPSLTNITTPLTWRDYPNLVGQGPLWFASMLLIFDFGYAALRLATRNRAPKVESASRLPGYGAIAAFVLALAVCSFLLRIVLPLGKAVLSFPTLAYLPEYLSFFIVGIVAARHDWLRRLPGSLGKAGLIAALVASALLFPFALFTSQLSFLGGVNAQAAVYALWDSIFSVGMCLALITFFRHRLGRPGRFTPFLTRHAFTVYIIHIPTIVFLAVVLRDLQLEHMLKFGLAAIIGVPLCFALAYLVRKIPYAEKVV